MTHSLLSQPADWTTPGAHPVTPGIYRIPLPMPYDGLRAINAYLIEDGDGVTMVDSGWAMPETEKAMAEALDQLGYTFSDITRFLITHVHRDHYTQALAFRASFGHRVHLGRGERRAFDVDGEPGSFAGQSELLAAHGASELAKQVAGMIREQRELDVPFEPPDEWLDDGQVFDLRDRRIEVFATPGHTQGHVVFRDAPAGLLFTGDHVLPHITPSIGLERVPAVRPLRDYLASLRLVRDLPDALLLPAHGPVSPSVHVRADELMAHHEERLAATLNAVEAGADTAYQVALSLPWTRRERRLDELEAMHQMMAVLEIAAHLDVLVDQGELAPGSVDGIRYYASV